MAYNHKKKSKLFQLIPYETTKIVPKKVIKKLKNYLQFFYGPCSMYKKLNIDKKKRKNIEKV